MEDEQRTGSEWEVIKLESETILTRTPWNQDINTEMSTPSSLTIRVTVRRQSRQQNIIFVAPLIGMYNITIHTSPISGLFTWTSAERKTHNHIDHIFIEGLTAFKCI
jgi:hypothetical protein